MLTTSKGGPKRHNIINQIIYPCRAESISEMDIENQFFYTYEI